MMGLSIVLGSLGRHRSTSSWVRGICGGRRWDLEGRGDDAGLLYLKPDRGVG